MIRALAAAALALPLLAQAVLAQTADPVLRAMKDELARVNQLRVVSANDPPYFIQYSLDDAEGFSCSASLGGLLSARDNRFRIPRVVVRVGSYEFDNTNYVLTGYYSGSNFAPSAFPIDDNYDALRQAFWLATDTQFKAGIEAIGRKKAAVRNLAQAEKLPDFAKAAPVELKRDVPRKAVDREAWKARAIALSTVFQKFPEVVDSSVDFQYMQTRSYLVNNEGSEIVQPDDFASVKINAAALAPDGRRVRDHLVVNALDLTRLPAEDELRKTVAEVAANVKALAAAPLGEAYNGPVLFEGVSGAQFFANMLGTGLRASRRPVAEPGRPAPYQQGELESRIGARVLPASMEVVDDPSQKDWKGRPLFGTYEVDGEGVVPRALALIENGVLKDLLKTRQPVKADHISNGRARIPGNFGAHLPAISNLFVRDKDGVPPAELRRRLMEMTVQRDKPYALLVKKLDYPSGASMEEIRRQLTASGSPASIPVLVYKLYRDGKEELVRGLRFRGLTQRSMKDISAASDELYQFDFMGNGAPLSLMGAGGYIFTASVVAPAILFDDLELEVFEDPTPRLPLVPPPPVTAR